MNFNEKVLFMSFLDKDNKPVAGMNTSLITTKSIGDECKSPDVFFSYLMSTMIKAFHSEIERTLPDHKKINYEQFTARFMENLSYWISKQNDKNWEPRYPTDELD